MEISAARPSRAWRPNAEALTWLVTAALLAAGSLFPEANTDLLAAVGHGLLSLLPVVAIAALLAGALTLGHWSDRVLAWLSGGPVRAVVVASFAGAITPVCGLGVLPLIATLLRRGLPLAPVMAFWVSSPITDPGMLVIAACVISVEEILRGLLPGEEPVARRLFNSLRLAPLGVTEGMRAGGWRRAFVLRGITLHQADCLIAAAAVGVGAALATANVDDFPLAEINVQHWLIET